jgi:hypothetical protein
MTPRALDPFLAFPAAFAPVRSSRRARADPVKLILRRSACWARVRWYRGHPARRACDLTAPDPSGGTMFDSVFDMVFLGRRIAAPAPGDPDELPQSFDSGGFEELPLPNDEDPSGSEATTAERLFAREISAGDEDTTRCAVFGGHWARTCRGVRRGGPLQAGGGWRMPAVRSGRCFVAMEKSPDFRRAADRSGNGECCCLLMSRAA